MRKILAAVIGVAFFVVLFSEGLVFGLAPAAVQNVLVRVFMLVGMGFILFVLGKGLDSI